MANWIARAIAASTVYLVLTSSSAATAQTKPTSTTALIDQHGQPFTLQQLRGKTVILNFIFSTCPTVCPFQTHALGQVLKQLPAPVRQRVHVLSVTLDPLRDDPATLRAFAANHGVPLSHWTFVTGAEDAVAAFRAAYSPKRALPNVAAQPPTPLDHRTEVRLLTRQGKVLQTYRGVPLDVPRLVREIQVADQLFEHDNAPNMPSATQE